MTDQDRAEFEAFMEPGYPTAREIWLAAREGTTPTADVLALCEAVVNVFYGDDWDDGTLGIKALAAALQEKIGGGA